MLNKFKTLSRAAQWAIILSLLASGVFVASASHTTPETEHEAARVYHSADQSISNTTWTDLSFDSERFDIGWHSTVTNTQRISPTTHGYYQVTCSANFASNSTGVRAIAIYRSGSTYVALVRQNAVSGYDTPLSVTTLVRLFDTDWVTCRVFQNSGAALNVTSTAEFTPEFMASLDALPTPRPTPGLR